MEKVFKIIDEEKDYYIKNLIKLVREPSIMGNSYGISQTVKILTKMLEDLGAYVTTERIGNSNPYIIAKLGSGEKKILFYSHYDVQPIQPIDEWEYGPFSGTIKENFIFSRGVADSKGTIYSRIAAIDSILKSGMELPCEIIFILDGEEEIGSPTIDEFSRKFEDLLNVDLCIWEAGFMDYKDRPVFSFGMKGLLYLELRCELLPHDLHSSWATIVENPAWKLIHALSSMRDRGGNINIEGIKEHIKPLPDVEDWKKNLSDFDFSFYREKLRIKEFLPIKEKITENHFLNPTFNICGIHSGYTKNMVKTILPHSAWANMDFRLVPNLTPDILLERIREHFKKNGFEDLEIKVKTKIESFFSPPDEKLITNLKKSSIKVFNREPLFIPMLTGSGPMYSLCSKYNPKVVSHGIAYYNSHVHAPNENIRISDLLNGIKLIVDIILNCEDFI